MSYEDMKKDLPDVIRRPLEAWVERRACSEESLEFLLQEFIEHDWEGEEALYFVVCRTFDIMTPQSRMNAGRAALDQPLHPLGEMLPEGVYKPYRQGDIACWGLLDEEGNMPEEIKECLFVRALVMLQDELPEEDLEKFKQKCKNKYEKKDNGA